jgi:hypothetical protein
MAFRSRHELTGTLRFFVNPFYSLDYGFPILFLFSLEAKRRFIIVGVVLLLFNFR